MVLITEVLTHAFIYVMILLKIKINISTVKKVLKAARIVMPL